MHEATRRLLGVLLRHLDGFETNKRSVVIAATNRKEDLDPALLSRYDQFAADTASFGPKRSYVNQIYCLECINLRCDAVPDSFFEQGLHWT